MDFKSFLIVFVISMLISFITYLIRGKIFKISKEE